jgi:signal peptidase I
MAWKEIKEKLKWIDPFTYLDFFIEFLHNKGIKYKALDWTLQILYALFLAYLTICIIGLFTGASKPVTIVVTGSMTPNVNIGDLLIIGAPKNIETTDVYIDENISGKSIRDYLTPVFVNGNAVQISVGEQIYDLNINADVVVYYSPVVDRDLVHRAVLRIHANDGIFYLTKGDNKETNFMLDEDCEFVYGQYMIKDACLYKTAIPESEIQGKMLFRIPYIGYVKVIPYRIISWIAGLF